MMKNKVVFSGTKNCRNADFLRKGSFYPCFKDDVCRGTDFPRKSQNLSSETENSILFFFNFPMSSILLLMYLCVCESSHLKNT